MSAPAIPSGPAAGAGPPLRDIHLPPDPAWWPPAPGWWVLAALVLLALLMAGWWWWRRRHLMQRRQRVLDEVERMAARFQNDGDHAALLSGLHQLLRRVARRHDALATQQRGAAWRQTLARVPVAAPTLERLLALEQAIYRPPAAFDAAATVLAVRLWLQLALQPATWKPLPLEPRHA